MDELEKMEPEVLGEDAEKAEEPVAESGEAGAENGADALVKELEEIRDMFQEALDSAANEQTENELIQELDEIEEDEAAETSGEEELPLCDCCGER